jgi:hypothetical protein
MSRAQILPDKCNAALERLIELAKGNTGQYRLVANFLLAWWNALDNGGFDLTELWSVDQEIAQDMIMVCRVIAAVHCYPDTLGYKKDFEEIWERWRGSAEAKSQQNGGAA